MNANSKFISRWGIPAFEDYGYALIHGAVMRHNHRFVYCGADPEKRGQQVGLTNNEFTFMCHVMSFKYDTPDSQAEPSLSTIAERMNDMTRNGVQKIKNSLIEKGALIVVERPETGQTNIYNFGPLAIQCQHFENMYSEEREAELDKLEAEGKLDEETLAIRNSLRVLRASMQKDADENGGVYTNVYRGGVYKRIQGCIQMDTPYNEINENKKNEGNTDIPEIELPSSDVIQAAKEPTKIVGGAETPAPKRKGRKPLSEEEKQARAIQKQKARLDDSSSLKLSEMIQKVAYHYGWEDNYNYWVVRNLSEMLMGIATKGEWAKYAVQPGLDAAGFVDFVTWYQAHYRDRVTNEPFSLPTTGYKLAGAISTWQTHLKEEREKVANGMGPTAAAKARMQNRYAARANGVAQNEEMTIVDDSTLAGLKFGFYPESDE